MWLRLDDADLLGLYRETSALDPEVTERVCGALRVLATSEYRQVVYAVTSLGQLRLTGASRWDVPYAGGLVAIGGQSSEAHVSYHPGENGGAPQSRVCSWSALADVLDVYCLRLVHEGSGRVFISEDADPDEPRLPLGAAVRVLETERERTPREGVVVEAVWHAKRHCWTYYLESAGRRRKGWYYGEDLVLRTGLAE